MNKGINMPQVGSNMALGPYFVRSQDTIGSKILAGEILANLVNVWPLAKIFLTANLCFAINAKLFGSGRQFITCQLV